MGNSLLARMNRVPAPVILHSFGLSFYAHGMTCFSHRNRESLRRAKCFDVVDAHGTVETWRESVRGITPE